MILYPTIELQNGRCVSLNRGRLDEPSVWHVDPVETARGFAAAGAQWMQVTDFDAIVGEETSSATVEDIIRGAGIPVQVAGGIRTREHAEEWLNKGAGRVVIGTMATRDPQTVKSLAKFYPDQIVLAVDVWQGQVMSEGWKSSSAFEPEAFIQEFDGVPFAGILVTDIDADVEDNDASLSLVTTLAAASRTPIVASGIVRTTDDIARLKYVSNVGGALVSRSLFRKTIDLAEALEVAQPSADKVAEFI
ncbi:1-(5-phosphoribosyl)-5-[(5-phosphoribosylamino)methylideneamino]imidazole-4-carboxamide isomerase [Cochlodiniinecator piscidefendens]|uniref:1-(5-phosphoribosyl)-5-[(5- phosphoribosylamino)methylideneamino]imidazole-4- carboxamide isomerase n=1 Tax=Cochlodiniinecator piscidefendens TaxID=2715756 RepID=UPI001409CA75|nr:1-(5-phosphoribosyl)-5-[(5-phosphoribosylamino)methylideneamino] imidazole-4-carboxamide isomerase [Cochlodiniinecator piscidefendens]